MNRIDLFNAAAVLVAIALATGTAFLGSDNERFVRVTAAEGEAVAVDLSVDVVSMADGRSAVVGADGVPVPLSECRRVIAGSSMAADAVLEFASSERILAIPALLARSEFAYRYGNVAVIDELADIEWILSLKPDLVVFNQVMETDVATRIRERGVPVFDLGSPTGAAAWARSVVELGTLCGEGERARRSAERYLRRLQAVASDVDEDERPTGLVVSSYGQQFFGGARGTSYHDVLTYAGLIDAAAGFRHWPQYDPEEIVRMNPEWLVTTRGMEEAICGHPVIRNLDACEPSNPRVVALPEALFADAGLRILDAAELLHRIVFDSRDE